MGDYTDYDAIGLAKLVRSGAVSAEELVEWALVEADAKNDAVNAIIHDLRDDARHYARAAPKGVFGGVPFLIKDSHAAYEGAPFCQGSRLLRDFRADRNSEILLRYRRAGLIVCGKTNLSEFGLLPVTEPRAFGPTLNPWNVTRTAGGSSGGSAAAVAARIVPMAHGSDGGGSLRIPAACCGVFGFKPSRGLAPTGPDMSELFFGYGTQHVISRSVRDSAAALDTIAMPDPVAFYHGGAPDEFLEGLASPPPPLRIALCRRDFLPSDVDAECVDAMDEAGALCAELGHDVEENAPLIDMDDFAHDYAIIVCAGALMAVRGWERHFNRRIAQPDIEVITDLCRGVGAGLSSQEVLGARDRLMRAQRELASFLTRHDVFLTPTLVREPLEVGAFEPTGRYRFLTQGLLTWPFRLSLGLDAVANRVVEQLVEVGSSFAPLAPLANVAGIPSMSVPGAFHRSGLPLGLMYSAAMGRDRLLLQLAAQIEMARPWDIESD